MISGNNECGDRDSQVTNGALDSTNNGVTADFQIPHPNAVLENQTIISNFLSPVVNELNDIPAQQQQLSSESSLPNDLAPNDNRASSLDSLFGPDSDEEEEYDTEEDKIAKLYSSNSNKVINTCMMGGGGEIEVGDGVTEEEVAEEEDDDDDEFFSAIIRPGSLSRKRKRKSTTVVVDDTLEGADENTGKFFFHNNFRSSAESTERNNQLATALQEENWTVANNLVDACFSNLVVDDVVDQVRSKVSRDINTVSFWNYKRLTQQVSDEEVVQIHFIPMFQEIRQKVYDTLKYIAPPPERVLCCGVLIANTLAAKTKLTAEQLRSNSELGHTINSNLDRVFKDIRSTYNSLNQLLSSDSHEEEQMAFASSCDFITSTSSTTPIDLDLAGGKLVTISAADRRFSSSDFKDMEHIMTVKCARGKITDAATLLRRKEKSEERAAAKKAKQFQEVRAQMRAEIIAELNASSNRQPIHTAAVEVQVCFLFHNKLC